MGIGLNHGGDFEMVSTECNNGCRRFLFCYFPLALHARITDLPTAIASQLYKGYFVYEHSCFFKAQWTLVPSILVSRLQNIPGM
jgi:hypothetical protein